MDLIDRESLLKKLEQFGLSNGCTIGMHSGITEILMEIVENEPTLGVVPKALYDQIKWERDMAISQLESFGVQLGEKANVKPVRHGKWLLEAHKGLSSCKCNVCNAVYESETNYCPKCGAKMDGD